MILSFPDNVYKGKIKNKSDMSKDEIIILITNRIKSEHRKHKDLEWERIAAYKIYASLKDMFKTND